jgi:speckle-type POZ protein
MNHQVSHSKVPSSPQSEKPKTKPLNLLAPTSYWCQSKGVVNEVDFEWTIERLAFLDDVKKWEPLISSEFSESRFRLQLSVVQYNAYTYVHIDLLRSTGFEYSSRVEIAIFNDKCKQITQKTSCFSPNTPFPLEVLSIRQMELLKSGNFVNGKMTIYCKIESLRRNQQSGKTTAAEKEIRKTLIGNNDQTLILDQLGLLFSTMDLSDVTFIIDDRQFSAHKIVLAMRSPVFKAMFHHPTKEVLSSKVVVKDIDPDVFQEVLRFIYTGKTQSMDKLALGILAAADKYLLEELKIQCETHLIRQMSAENCLELLSLTTHHPAEHLKKYALDYFRRCPGKSIFEKVYYELAYVN